MRNPRCLTVVHQDNVIFLELGLILDVFFTVLYIFVNSTMYTFVTKDLFLPCYYVVS